MDRYIDRFTSPNFSIVLQSISRYGFRFAPHTNDASSDFPSSGNGDGGVLKDPTGEAEPFSIHPRRLT